MRAFTDETSITALAVGIESKHGKFFLCSIFSRLSEDSLKDDFSSFTEDVRVRQCTPLLAAARC